MPHPTWFGRIEWFRRWRYAEPETPRAEDQELLIRSAADSRFASCPEILLGYRQGPYSVAKTLKGRFGRAGAFARYARDTGDHTGALLVWAVALAKAGVDVLAGLPGMDALYFQRMSEAPTTQQHAEWKALWRCLRLQGDRYPDTLPAAR